MEFTKAEMEAVHKYLGFKFDEFIKLYGAVMEQKGFLNDHNNSWEPHEDYVVLWQAGEKYICPIYPSSACCLNPLYLDENGKVHLSRNSIGGNVYGKDIAKYNLQHGVYNRVNHYASLQAIQDFSTRDNEETIPW